MIARPPGPQFAAPPPLKTPAAAPSRTSAKQRTNGQAIASVVLGAIGLVPILLPSLAGLILGIAGLRRTEDRAVGGRKVAITGIILSAVTILLVPLWAAILIPAYNQRHEAANRRVCQEHMKAIGEALRRYASAHDAAYPRFLEDVLISENLPSQIFVCPSSNDSAAPGENAKTQAQNLSAGAHLSYVYIGQRLTSYAVMPEVVVLYEPLDNHDDGCNFLYADGHVEFIPSPTAEQMISQIQSGQNPPKR
jgi:prepilin-type processing-associated H-X9-DG protein